MFRRERKRIQAIKKGSKEGASLVIVVCISAFLTAFALAMAHTAGLLLSQANQRLGRERAYELAQSFARTLDRELLGYDKPEAAASDSFYRFACKFLEDTRYAVYNPDYPESTVFYYSAGEQPAGEDYGEITVALYKESYWDNDKIKGPFVYNSSDEEQDPLGTVAGSVNHYAFTVRVTAAVGEASYSYSTVYDQEVSYNADVVIFTGEGGTLLKWDESIKKWRERNTGNVYYAAENEEMQYEIQPRSDMVDMLSGCKFTKNIPEKGEQQEFPEGESGEEESE